jgi:small GTP-binding protein
MVVVGDSAVGKTCLQWAYAKQAIPHDYVPTVFDNFTVKLRWVDTIITLQVWDTAGLEDLENIRVLAYANVHVFLICYSLGDPTSLMNVQRKWLPELTRHIENLRFILVGTKKDLRNHDETRFNLSREGCSPIDPAEGEAKAIELGASGYVEWSVVEWEGVEEVFDLALRVAQTPVKEKKKKGEIA